MFVAAALGSPDECTLIRQEAQIVAQVDPGRAGLAEQQLRFQRVDVDEHEIETPLVARLALERDVLPPSGVQFTRLR